MYRETVESNKKTLFGLLGASIGVLALFFVFDAISLPYRTAWELILFAALGILLYLLIRLNLSEYSYILEKNKLVFQKKSGHADLPLLTVDLCKIRSLQPYEAYREDTPIPREFSYNLKKNLNNKNAWVCTFYENRKLCKVIFEPTQTLVARIEKSLENITGEDDANK